MYDMVVSLRDYFLMMIVFGLLRNNDLCLSNRIKAWILSAVLWGNESVCIRKDVTQTPSSPSSSSSILPKSRTTLWQASQDLTVLLGEKKEQVRQERQACTMQEGDTGKGVTISVLSSH